MTQGLRPPTPTTEQRRHELEHKERSERFGTIQKHLTQGGSATRPTLGNMVAILTHFQEWNGVLGVDLDVGTPTFVKKPPFGAEYDIRGERNYPAAVTREDTLRLAIWFEKNAHLVVDRAEHLEFVLFAMKLVGERGPK